MCGFTYNTIIHRYFMIFLWYLDVHISYTVPAMSFRNASELVHSSSPLSGVRSEPGFGSTWESVQRAHRRWSKKDDAQKDVFCVFTSYCMFCVYKNMTLITSMGKKMWKQVIFQQSGAHLTSARARTLGSAAPLPWWWSTCGGRCGSRDAGTAVALMRSKKEVQLPNQVSW